MSTRESAGGGAATLDAPPPRGSFILVGEIGAESGRVFLRCCAVRALSPLLAPPPLSVPTTSLVAAAAAWAVPANETPFEAGKGGVESGAAAAA